MQHRLASLQWLMVICLGSCIPAMASDRINLRFDSSEADAVLSIVAKLKHGQPVSDDDWNKLFATEPYQRLKKREAGMHRDFTGDDFKKFVGSDFTLKHETKLRRTLAEWESANLNAAAERVLSYLPAQSVIRAKVFPVVKPQTNSFVFDTATDPAIFLYLDPSEGRARFEITVAHELHHIGLSSTGNGYEQEISSLPDGPKHAAEWMGAFGEGLAMLAAAGGANVDPVATYKPELQAEWKRDMQNFNHDLKKVEQFLLDVTNDRIRDENEIQNRAMKFFGSIGPWYSVGYRMAVVVEQNYGRAALIDCMLDFRKLLASYNRAAAKINAQGNGHLALWSQDLLKAVKAVPVQ